MNAAETAYVSEEDLEGALQRAEAAHRERNGQDGRQHTDSLAHRVDGMFRLVMNFKFRHRTRIISQWTRTNS